MQRENSLDALTIRDAPNGERFVESTSFTANHYAGKYLDSFFVSFHDARVNTYAITHGKRRQITFLLFFLDDVDNAIHKVVPPRATAGAHSHSEARILQPEFAVLIIVENTNTSTTTITSTRMRRNSL
jgi:hypothetical protein